MSIKLQLPKLVDLKPRLTVIGVGGAGCNAINNMIAAGLQGVDFVVANTDAQSLAASSAEHRVQLGASLTEGLGAGSRPEIGEAAALEALEELRSFMAGSHMVFVAAGMGGGTGTGAAAVIAKAARELGILTVGIVCKPFQFEGARRMRIAEAGVQSLRQHVDTLIVIPNQNLFRIANERTTFAEAFVLADQVLYSGVACIVELVLKEGLINLDFADVKTVMSGMGSAMMGTGEATGERRAVLAAEEAIANPLLDDVTLRGAKGLLLSITGGRDMTLYEVDEAASRVREEVDPEANIIVGATFDENLGDRLRVSIVASGMNRAGEILQTPQAAAETPPPAHHAYPFVPPQPASSPVAQVSPPAAMQQRLADALQQQAPIAAPPPLERWTQGIAGTPAAMPQASYPQAMFPHNSHAGSHHGYAMGEDTGAPAHDLEDQIRHARSTWAAPGNVMIEEGLPGSTRNSVIGSAPVTPAAPAPMPAISASNFIPSPPVELPRAARRLPTVEDFPAHAQRQLQARGELNHPTADHRKATGFFGRIAGLGRKATADQETRGVANQTHEDDSQLPILFGRERR